MICPSIIRSGFFKSLYSASARHVVPYFLAIADNVRVGYVVLRVVDVFLHQTCVRLTGGSFVLRKVRVYQYLVECYAFALQSLQYEVVYRPECVLRETVCA